MREARTDVVGSLLRPPRLLAAREQPDRGELRPAETTFGPGASRSPGSSPTRAGRPTEEARELASLAKTAARVSG